MYLELLYINEFEKTMIIRKIHIINLQINGPMKKKKKFMFQFLIGRLSTGNKCLGLKMKKKVSIPYR